MTGRLIDAYARVFDITGTHVVVVDAQPPSVVASLQRLPLSAPATTAIETLGIAGRLASGTERLAARGAYEQVYGLLWRLAPGPSDRQELHDLRRFADPGYVKVIWDVRVHVGAEAGAVLASTTRFVATDGAARERLHGAWGLLGPVSKMLAERALRTVKRHAEEHDEVPVARANLALAA